MLRCISNKTKLAVDDCESWCVLFDPIQKLLGVAETRPIWAPNSAQFSFGDPSTQSEPIHSHLWCLNLDP